MCESGPKVNSAPDPSSAFVVQEEAEPTRDEAEARIEKLSHSLVEAIERAIRAESQLTALTAERDAYKRDFDAELDGNAAIRRRYGARDDESFIAFIERLYLEASQLTALRQSQVWQPWPPPDEVMRVLAWREDAGVFIAEYQNPFEGDCCWFSDGGGEDLTGDLPTQWAPLPCGPVGEPA